MEDNQRSMFKPNQFHSKVMEIFMVYADPISDILGDSTLTLKGYEIMLQDLDMEIPFSSDIWDFIKDHERTLAFFAKRHLEIQEHGGETAKIFLKNNLYKKYINGLRKKKIGRVKDESVLESYDKAYWNRQVLFKEIVEENISKYYHEYHYTTVEDVLNFFSGGKDYYNKFLNETGDFDFNLSHDSIAKYMKNIARFFCKKRIHFKGHRLNIYSLVN